jgi:hypothetical protein
MSSVSNALMMGQLQISVARKQLDAIEQQGRDAITLIESSAPPEVAAAAPPPNTNPGVGGHVNVAM